MTMDPFDRRLSAVLVAAILGVAVLASVAAFAFSFREAQELQDDALRQIATMASHDGAVSETPINVLHMPPDPAPSWMPAHRRDGFHTVHGPTGSMRAYLVTLPNGDLVAVTQDTVLRQDVAVGSALQALVPVLLLIPVVAWLTLRTVRAERAAIERQRRFIASAAHELRSPLTAMAIQAGNIESPADGGVSRERLAALRAGLDRTRRVAEQLLALAQVQTVQEARERVELVPLARELIADAMPLAIARRIDLGLEERASPVVQGSANALRLILSNGLDNALRHSTEGSVVTVRIASDAVDAIVDIEDSGPGIPPEARTRVFEPFERLEGTHEGAGLGLAIVRDATQRQGGTIELLDGAGGRGVLFRYRQRLDR